MEIDEATATAASAATSTSSGLLGSGNAELGREDFLLMLITQLENQDPLNPQHATEFTSQLAEFSSLDQLISMRTAIDGLAAAQSSGRRLDVASLVGQGVLAESREIEFGTDTAAQLHVELDREGPVRIRLRNDQGSTVGVADLGVLPPGVSPVNLAAFDRPIPPGRFRIEIESLPDGPSVTPLVESRVTGASLDPGDPSIFLGGVAVSIDDVRDLRFPPQSMPTVSAPRANEEESES